MAQTATCTKGTQHLMVALAPTLVRTRQERRTPLCGGRVHLQLQPAGLSKKAEFHQCSEMPTTGADRTNNTEAMSGGAFLNTQGTPFCSCGAESSGKQWHKACGTVQAGDHFNLTEHKLGNCYCKLKL